MAILNKACVVNGVGWGGLYIWPDPEPWPWTVYGEYLNPASDP